SSSSRRSPISVERWNCCAYRPRGTFSRPMPARSIDAPCGRRSSSGSGATWGLLPPEQFGAELRRRTNRSEDHRHPAGRAVTSAASSEFDVVIGGGIVVDGLGGP